MHPSPPAERIANSRPILHATSRAAQDWDSQAMDILEIVLSDTTVERTHTPFRSRSSATGHSMWLITEEHRTEACPAARECNSVELPQLSGNLPPTQQCRHRLRAMIPEDRRQNGGARCGKTKPLRIRDLSPRSVSPEDHREPVMGGAAYPRHGITGFTQAVPNCSHGVTQLKAFPPSTRIS